MEENHKSLAFEHFCSIIDKEYESVFGADQSVDPYVKRTELYNQKLLYFSCLFSKNFSLFKIFDNWQSWEKGPVEVDVHNDFFEI